MERKRSYRKQSATFGPWLRAAISAAGLTLGEFAAQVGAGKSSVSRWVNGRVPEASFIDAIADVLVMDYDLVAEKAGYRPALPTDELDAMHARLDPYLLQVIDNNHALDTVEATVKSVVAGFVAAGQPAAPAPSVQDDPAASPPRARPARSS
jgi:transcriptional regulator with XRE-family HTH domain